MSTASLTKLTVPLASDQSNSAQGLLMPKLKFRFRVTFLNLGVSQPTQGLTLLFTAYAKISVSFI